MSAVQQIHNMILLSHQMEVSEAKQCLTEVRQLFPYVQQCHLLVYNDKPLLQEASAVDGIAFFSKGDRALWSSRIKKKYLKPYMSHAYEAMILLRKQAAPYFTQLIAKACVPIKIACKHGMQHKGINIFLKHQNNEELRDSALLVSSHQFFSNIKQYEY